MTPAKAAREELLALAADFDSDRGPYRDDATVVWEMAAAMARERAEGIQAAVSEASPTSQEARECPEALRPLLAEAKAVTTGALGVLDALTADLDTEIRASGNYDRGTLRAGLMAAGLCAAQAVVPFIRADERERVVTELARVAREEP